MAFLPPLVGTDAMKLLNRLTYRPELTGLARTLGLRAVLRKLYYENALRITPGLPRTGWPTTTEPAQAR